jgi:hypothetical protein
MGEILCSSRKNVNSFEDFTWDDVIFRDDESVLVRIKISKTKNVKGDYIDLFENELADPCPVKALKKLFHLKSSLKIIGKHTPVFQFENGLNLTTTIFNKTLQSLLHTHLGTAAKEYSGHSLRAGIPSILAEDSSISVHTELKAWGRWNSAAYQKYTRLKIQQKRSLYGKIIVALKK